MSFRANGTFQLVIIFGIVSLFADITYEGARSIIGPYLYSLGGSPASIGIVVGFGELVGFAMRILSGYFSDRTRKYFGMTVLGYIINLFSVPLLGLARTFESASVLIISERLGKAIRTPSRDALLSKALESDRRGLGFGIHEALDQIGAILGPILCAFVLRIRGDYREAFFFLLIPAILSIFFLSFAKGASPSEKDYKISKATKIDLRREFFLYLCGMALIGAGYFDFALIAYHFKDTGAFSIEMIPILYAFAMAVDGLFAPVLGRLYDRFGLKAILFSSALSSISSPFIFLLGPVWTYLGMFLWGFGMASQESISRAHIASLVAEERRGYAYGIFNGVYGLFWFLGSSLLGILYGKSILYAVFASFLLQLFSLPFFYASGRHRS